MGQASNGRPQRSPEPLPPHRILYYSHTRQVSGAERVLLNMLAVLDRGRYAPMVACPVEGPGNLDVLVNQASVQVLPVPAVQARFTTNPMKLASYLASVLRAIIAVRRTILQANPDLVHANSVRAGIVATLATCGTGTKILWHVQDDLPDHPISTLIRVIARVSRRTRFVAVSRHTAQVFQGSFRFPGRLSVLHNGVDLARFPWKTALDRDSRFRRALAIQPEDFLIVAVGMISPRKGLLELIDAFALAVGRLPPNTHLAMVGAPIFNRDDLYLERLQNRIETLGLQERIHLPGPSSDVAAVLRTADLLVLNARAEPFGLVLVEAAASGTPILATDVGGARDILFAEQVSCGFSTPPPQLSHPAALAERLIGIVDNPEARALMAERASARVASCFSLETFGHRLNTLYDESCTRLH
jgi:glycosyltransferase involved in cell wall biosynthesis